MMRSLLILAALLGLSAPALAQTRALPPGEIRANGDITFGNALKLGKREGNKTVITPDTLQILGAGSTGDASVMSVAPPVTGARSRTFAARARERLSVADFPGADPTGATSSQAAFDAACAAANPGETILIPPGSWKPGTPSCTKFVQWLASGAAPDTGLYLTLPGLVEYAVNARRTFLQQKSGPLDFSTIEVTRNADYTGGQPGFVNSAAKFETKTGTGPTSFEWALVSIMDNYAASGENVANYNRARKYGQGPTWAGVDEIYDYTGPNPTTSSVVREVDIRGNGNDQNGVRFGYDFVLTRNSNDPTKLAFAEATSAIRFQGEPGQHRWKNLISMHSSANAGNGINFSEGNIEGAAVLLKAEQRICFETAYQFCMNYNAATGALSAPNRFRVYGLPIGSTAGAVDTPLSLGANTGSDDTLKFQVVRPTAGSDWTSAIWRIGRQVDGTPVSPTIDIGSGSVAVTGGVLKLPAYTVATLPVCNASSRDAVAVATDLTTASSTTFRGVPAGGGTARGPVYCDGASWTVH